MPVYKDKKRGTWYIVTRYKDWTGKLRTTTKRGFKTKMDAKNYEIDFTEMKNNSLSMTFGSFVKIYMDSMQNRLKENTLLTKQTIIEKKLLPYFKDKKLCDITPKDVIYWQNEMMKQTSKKDKEFSPTYLKTVHNQLSAIFNYAVRYYGLKDNPARIAGCMGKETNGEMQFWTKEEYMKFSKAMMKKDGVFQAFEMLYWCGIRLGEMLALTPSDFDFEKKTVRINKSYQRLHGKDIITDPKTAKSNRVVQMPDFLADEMQDYISRFYTIEPDERIFILTKSFLHHEMDRGCKETGVKRIRIHDLRHSHVSLLIEMGFTAVDIANRVGHESVKITYRYAHMFPSKDEAIAKKLTDIRGGAFDEQKES